MLATAQISTQIFLELRINSKPPHSLNIVGLGGSTPHCTMSRGPPAVTLKGDVHSTVPVSKQSVASDFCVSKIEIVITAIT